MVGIWDIAKYAAGGNFLFGTPEVRENVSTLRPEQEGLLTQAVNAGMNKGAGGVFGDSADYYRDVMSDDSETFNKLSAPEIRRYNEDIVPMLSEQFAGMGSGGLSSSGFRNAQIQGATDLSERLGSLRAQLRNSAAQGLQNIGQIGLQNYSQNMATEQGTPGLLSQIAPTVGTAIGAFYGGPGGAYAGNQIGTGLNNSFGSNNVGAQSGPYQSSGGGIPASPKRMR
jgi:hypothetical protein